MIIRLNKKIYGSSAVRQARRAFSHLARIKLKEDGKYFLVEAKNIDSDVKAIFCDEFCNFALGSIKK